MEVIVNGPDGRRHGLTDQPLLVRYDEGRDFFEAVAEGHADLAADPLADALYEGALRFLIAAPEDRIVGFQVLSFSASMRKRAISRCSTRRASTFRNSPSATSMSARSSKSPKSASHEPSSCESGAGLAS